eukprot:COSAG04_NODE_7368_length_1139_cov_1.114423_2_plen_103_part_01
MTIPEDEQTFCGMQQPEASSYVTMGTPGATCTSSATYDAVRAACSAASSPTYSTSATSMAPQHMEQAACADQLCSYGDECKLAIMEWYTYVSACNPVGNYYRI